MALDGFKSISAAAGNESAARPEKRRDPLPIATDQNQHHLRKSTIASLEKESDSVARYDG